MKACKQRHVNKPDVSRKKKEKHFSDFPDTVWLYKTSDEEVSYDTCSTRLNNASDKFKTYIL